LSELHDWGTTFRIHKQIETLGLQNPKCLSLGCGESRQAGWTNLDQYPLKEEGYVRHDLESYPWPFSDASFDVIYASHVLEHMSDPIRFLNECHRITKIGGYLIVRVPHAARSSNNCELTHKRLYSIYTLYNIAESRITDSYSSIKRWSRIVSARFGFYMNKYYPYQYFLEWASNKRPSVYEHVFANIFPPYEVITVIQK
jgi:ubiquinone/menaquinone biosynthesis C-methylase UbiE